jgi:hypothetical protein
MCYQSGQCIYSYKLEKVKHPNWHSGGEDAQTIPAETLSPQGIWGIFTLQTELILVKLWTAFCSLASFHELQ